MINRRNVLIGLGTGVAAGGAAIGTGAFSQVTATRDVNIDTSDDTEAYVILEAASGADNYVSQEGGQLQIDLDDLNQNSVTEFDSLVEVSLGDDASDDVEIDNVSASIVDETDGIKLLDDNASDEPYEIGLEIDLENHTPTGGEIEITVETIEIED